VRERRKAAALARHYRDEEGLSIAEIAPAAPTGRGHRQRRTSTTHRKVTKDPRMAPSANASLGATRPAYAATPGPTVARGVGRPERAPPWRGGPAYAGSRPALERTQGAPHARVRVAAPRRRSGWDAQADSAAWRLVSQSPPDARASRRDEACAPRAPAGGSARHTHPSALVQLNASGCAERTTRRSPAVTATRST
jgi:hypothetical protein